MIWHIDEELFQGLGPVYVKNGMKFRKTESALIKSTTVILNNVLFAKDRVGTCIEHAQLLFS